MEAEPHGHYLNSVENHLSMSLGDFKPGLTTGNPYIAEYNSEKACRSYWRSGSSAVQSTMHSLTRKPQLRANLLYEQQIWSLVAYV